MRSASSASPTPRSASRPGEVVLPAPAPGALPALLRAPRGTWSTARSPTTRALATLRLGPAVLVFVPGEPVADVGEAWRAEAGAGAEIVSLAGGYVGYVETPDQIAARRGETVRTYYGPELAARLGHAVVATVTAVRAEPAARDEEAAAVPDDQAVGAARAGSAR